MAVAASLPAACLLFAGAGPARADGGGTNPFIQFHAAYSAGQTGDLTVGTVIVLRYVDPSSSSSVRQFCWDPAPIAQPACTVDGTGAPSKSGTQKVTAQLNNGQSVSTTFPIGAAATSLGTATGKWSPPVLYTSTCVGPLSGDAGGAGSPVGEIAVGQQLAGYYVSGKVTQVYDYASNTPGFFSSSCLSAPAAKSQSYVRTVRLKANRTATYTLSLPSTFQPKGPATPYSYTLYVGNQSLNGVSNSIDPKVVGGEREPFLGATVLREAITKKGVTITVRTGKLSRPITLRLGAHGTA